MVECNAMQSFFKGNYLICGRWKADFHMSCLLKVKSVSKVQ